MDFNKLKLLLLKERFWIITVSLIITFAVALYNIIVPLKFKPGATLAIAQKTDLYSSLLTGLPFMGGGTILESENNIIYSNRVINKTIEELGLMLDYDKIPSKLRNNIAIG